MIPSTQPRRVAGGTTRRSALIGALALAGGLTTAAAPAAAAPAAATAPPRARAPRRSLDAAYAFLDRMSSAYAPAGEPRLAQSYADQLGLFSTAFVYDNALAVCAHLSSPSAAHRARAVDLGDGLLYAMAHDPVHDDDRLRQGYNVGPYTHYDGSVQPHRLVLPNGDANTGRQFGFLGTAVGDMAWPGIALAQLAVHARSRRFLDGALRIARWILDNAVNPGPLGGYSFGVDGADQRIANVSTEHNIDVYGFFRLLARLTGEEVWNSRAQRARAFVERMWEPAGGYFYTGSNDGSSVNRTPRPLDPQTWGWLALREPEYAGAVDWAASALATTDTPTSPNSQLPAGFRVSGVTFSDASKVSTASYDGRQVDPHGVWFEGTGQLVAAWRDRGAPGDRRRAERSLAEVRAAQAVLGQGQTVGGAQLPAASGLVAASSAIDTGFGFGYFQVQHVGATAWYLMGAQGKNPYQYRGL